MALLLVPERMPDVSKTGSLPTLLCLGWAPPPVTQRMWGLIGVGVERASWLHTLERCSVQRMGFAYLTSQQTGGRSFRPRFAHRTLRQW